MALKDKTPLLEAFLLAHTELLRDSRLADVAEAFTAETGLSASIQWVANIADSLKLKRRRKRGSRPTTTAKERREVKKARQRRWLANKRAARDAGEKDG